MSEDKNLRFVEMANPHSWLVTADNLHAQAVALSKSRGSSALTFRDYQEGTRISWDAGNRAMFLLGGFALENAIKAFLVYENPQWISNGKLSGQLRSHSLTKLRDKAQRIPYKRQYLWVLRQFEAGIDSWSRYPCALTAEETFREGHLHATLWNGYLRLMDAYGNRMREIMAREVWKGPHGFEGRWQFYGKPTGDDISMGRKGFRALSSGLNLRTV
jgi:hypothetical protein